jgi:hypothetical protein
LSVASKYKVVEIATVTDEEIERVLNEWVAQGWRLETIHFAMRESSKRPSMAFVSFTRQEEEG